jgi:hypothetical protein|uniref:Uncharacterized protein n=1 Tax=viral metagenome TaxID=1070528 RepID=A0A6C0AHZ2_9ZZZZ
MEDPKTRRESKKTKKEKKGEKYGQKHVRAVEFRPDKSKQSK